MKKIEYSLIENKRKEERSPLLLHLLVGAFTLATISSVFCIFLFIKFMDDFIQLITPSRLLTFAKYQILNEWEKKPTVINDQLLASFMNHLKRKKSK